MHCNEQLVVCVCDCLARHMTDTEVGLLHTHVSHGVRTS